MSQPKTRKGVPLFTAKPADEKRNLALVNSLRHGQWTIAILEPRLRQFSPIPAIGFAGIALRRLRRAEAEV